MGHFSLNGIHLYLSKLNISKKNAAIINRANVLWDIVRIAPRKLSLPRIVFFLTEILSIPFLLHERRLSKINSFANDELGKKA